MPEGQIVKGYIMPGMPHVMLPTQSASRRELRDACRVAGRHECTTDDRAAEGVADVDQVDIALDSIAEAQPGRR